MRTFEHDGNMYLQIKDHNFHILNALGNSNDPHYIQCTTNSSSGIVKEYLPQGWELLKARYNGQMIFTLYKKSYFAYKSKSKSIGTLIFIALSTDGAEYLLYRWLLNEQLGLDDTKINIEIIKENINNRMTSNVYSFIRDQNLKAISVNMNHYDMEDTLEKISEIIVT